MQEMQIQSLGQEYPLEKEMATHSSILAWKIPCTEEADGLQSMWSQRVRRNLVTEHALMSYSLHTTSVSIWSVQFDSFDKCTHPSIQQTNQHRELFFL